MKFTLKVHDDEVSEVMGELCVSDMPGVRLLGEDLKDEREPAPALVSVKKTGPRRSPWLQELLRVYPTFDAFGDLDATKVKP